MPKLIYITRRIPEVGITALKNKGYLIDVGEKEEAPAKEEIISALSKKVYDGVVTFLTDPIDAEIFNACPSAKIYAQFAMGFDNIDVKEAAKRSIIITNTPGVSSRAVAEHTVALALALSLRLVEGDKYVRDKKYTSWMPYLLIGSDLTGKTVGLIGVGNIGSEVAGILRNGFNCKIIYTDVNRNTRLEEKCDAKFTDQETVFKESDIVSLHVPLLDPTRHLVNAKTLAMMKKTAFLINTSRGPVVEESALVEALKNGMIRGAGLDVFEFEPKISEELMTLPNIVMTPHIASARESVRNKMAEVVANNLIAFFETGKAINPAQV